MLKDYSLYPPQIQQRLEELKRKVLDGTDTPDELREAISLMQEGRLSAAQLSAPKKPRASKKSTIPPARPNADLLKDF